MLPYDASLEEIKKRNPKGIIFTGGPAVVTDKDAPLPDPGVFELGVPILGICYGCQLMGQMLGGAVEASDIREYGSARVSFRLEDPLFWGLDPEGLCWMSHTYQISETPPGFRVIASTPSCEKAAISNNEKKLYGVQFHPEVVHTPQGEDILRNFLNICQASADWRMEDFAAEAVAGLKEKLEGKKALCALSGGVDSSVAAVLLNRAIGQDLICVFVDNGLLRLNEAIEVEELFKNKYEMNFKRVDASQRFLSKLEGVVDPEKKRKVIGEEFIRVFEEESKKIGKVDYLVQGTIYPDVIESGSKNAAVIKSHHNVGGLPEAVDFKEIVEPLRSLFKDEVRRLGVALGMPDSMVYRQPFPGPGLAVRCLGEVTEEKLEILRKADFIFREEIARAGLDRDIWQYFAVIPNLLSVGVMGDERTYAHAIALRAVASTDAMTADWAEIPHSVLKTVSNRIVNEVPKVNRVVYDITSKPPATIEWE
jgi:GMP synthase (glutamine-hydrolysing)